ncbi:MULTISPECIES: site-2 protease family protein [unclassified Gordonia (in: high G+C Gram-positive bacteria)]
MTASFAGRAPSGSGIVKTIGQGLPFLILLALTAFGGWLCFGSAPGRNATSIAGTLLLVIAGWLVSLCLHEFAHAVTAFRFGDRTAELRGYLTLNPLRYTHPGLSLGLPILIILLGGIGFPGGAVYLDERGMTRGQRTLVSLAGPAMNILLGALILMTIRIIDPQVYIPLGSGPLSGLVLAVDGVNLWAALAMLAFLQITAAVLNLIPMPGFDGYGAIEPYLAPDVRQSATKIAPYGFLIVFALLFIPQLNAAFFDLIRWLFELSGVPSALAIQGWNVFMFWRTS